MSRTCARNRVFSDVETRDWRKSDQFTDNSVNANQKLGFSVIGSNLRYVLHLVSNSHFEFNACNSVGCALRSSEWITSAIEILPAFASQIIHGSIGFCSKMRIADT